MQSICCWEGLDTSKIPVENGLKRELIDSYVRQYMKFNSHWLIGKLGFTKEETNKVMNDIFNDLLEIGIHR